MKKVKEITLEELFKKAQGFSLSPNDGIFDEGDWLFMFFCPKTKEDIEILNLLYQRCRGKDIPSIFDEDSLNQLIAMEYTISNKELDWSCFYNVTEIVKYNTQGKFKVVPVE